MNRDRRIPHRIKALAAGITVALVLGLPVATPAFAFELFGIHLWGEKKQTEQAAEDIPDPIYYKVELTVDDSKLKERLESVSLLVTKRGKPPSGTIGLLTRAKNDKKRLVAALFSAARYGGTVNILINGNPFEVVPIDAVLDRGVNDVVIHIQTGPAFTFASPDAATTTGQRINLTEFGVVAGKPARSEVVVAAEKKLVSAWRDKGYAFARIASREMIADHNDRELEVDLRLDPGPLTVFGEVSVSGAEDVDPEFIIQQANIPVGATFSPKRLADGAKRLRGLGVFDSVVISEAEQPGPGNSVAISIEVSERKPRTFGVGVTAATDDGLGAETFWVHRNLFGRAESLRIEGAVSGVGRSNLSTSFDYLIAATFTKPGVWGPTTTFKSRIEAQYQDTDAFEKQSIGGSVGLSREFNDHLSGEIGLNVEYADYQDTTGPTTSLLISTPIQAIQDTRDNKLNPTSGYRLLLAAEPTYDAQNGNSFLKMQAAFSTYRAVNEERTLVLAGKIAAGSIIGTPLSQIPADRRFYAGGGGSIRGYGYQLASPRIGDMLTGGLSLVEASLEARYSLTETIGLAVFVDSGGAFTSSTPGQGGTWYTGVGAGVRYLTPVGPFRLDVGIPLNKIDGDPDFGIYLGLGQAF
ncbi:MAG: outer membrane protein assembly factor [Hyphomicrobiales bacterium]|nr:outer membrane protein assembly factor [Hyphomicrobiales bacterium]